MLQCEKVEKDLERCIREDEQTLKRRQKKARQELVAGKEQELKKKLVNFKTRQETILIEIQKKWQTKLEEERKKSLHDNIVTLKENEKTIVHAKIDAVNAKPQKGVGKAIYGPHTKTNSDKIDKKFDVSQSSKKG